MVSIRRYFPQDKEIWNEFNAKSKTHLFMFDRDYMDYHNDRFLDHSLMIYSNEKLVALIPLSEHEHTLKSHGGLTFGGVISDEHMNQELMQDCVLSFNDYCIQNGFDEYIYKKIPQEYSSQPAEEDVYSLKYFGAELYKVEASTMIQLNNPLNMSKLRKRRINKANKSGVVVEVDDSQVAYDKFLALQDEILVKHHGVHAVHNGKEMYKLHTCFPSNIHLYAAKLDNEIIGGSIVYIYPNLVHTQYLCANDIAREVGALDATIDFVMTNFMAGKEWLDFGISTENDGSYLNLGLINQKETFGGRTVVYYTWKKQINI